MAARLAVFAGPSLPPGDRIARPGVTYLPSASRHDVRDASREFGAILLIDGVFHHDLAVSTKEVYRAGQSIPVFGAASVGALRAVENYRYGVRPLGAIARWYLHEIIDGDDEVAVSMDRERHRALSVPMVNVRYLCRLCVRRGLLGPADAADVIRRSRSVFYAERSWEDVLSFVPAHRRERIAAIASREADLKRLDAVFALRSVFRTLKIVAPEGDQGRA
jgi:TfuA protein